MSPLTVRALSVRFLVRSLALLLPLVCAAQAPVVPRANIVPIEAGSQRSAASAVQTAPHFDYYGGPVISNIQVVVVYWGRNVSPVVTGGIAQFFSSIVDSSYLDMLSEYGTAGVVPAAGGAPGNQRIGHGSLLGEYTITPSTGSRDVSDGDIQDEIRAQVGAGHLPAPTLDMAGNVNTWYVIYFPPGVHIAFAGMTSCTSGGFCGYHSTLMGNDNRLLPYGVFPDYGSGSGCDVQCGGGTEFDNLTANSAHEMAESIADAGVGQAVSHAPPLAWYDTQNDDEIVDACPSRSTLGGYTVQNAWSNLHGACVSLPPVFHLAAPPTSAAGAATSVPVTIQSSGGTTLANYRGTIHFSSSDPAAVLPPDYTFTAADAGSHTFAVTLNTVGPQAIAVNDARAVGFTGQASISVQSAAMAHLALTAPSAVAAGASLVFTVTAQDAANNTVTSYTGPVHFTSSDSAASLPPDSTLTNGVGIFTAVLRTLGNQALTATDAANPALAGSATVAVGGTSGIILTTPTPSVTVTSGQSVQVPLTASVSPAVTVVFSCSGLPANTACTFTPSSAGQGTSNVSMTINTAATVATGPSAPALWAMLSLPAFGFVLLPAGGLRRRWPLLAIALLVLALAGCAGSSTRSTSRTHSTAPPGVYPVLVMAQGGGLQGQTTVTVTIR